MASPTATTTAAENDVPNAHGGDDGPQNVGPTAPTAGDALVADPDDTDADSALGESTDGSYSTSPASLITNYVYENGQRYHSYREGQYPLPNDEIEQDRLDMIHHIYRMLVGGLYWASISKGRPPPMRVLDLGTGTGTWAIEMADEFPNAIVIGADLSPIETGWVPPNFKFYVDDFESDWDHRPNEYFDYIHGWALCGSVGNWPRFFKLNGISILKNAIWVMEWSPERTRPSIKFGERIRSAQDIKKWMEEAGFLDVHEEIYKAPVGTWPKDKNLKRLGKFYRAALLDASEP